MQIIALLPILAILAGIEADARTSPKHHERQVNRIASAIEKRELADAMAAMQKRVEADIASREGEPKRVVRRAGAGGCRVKGSNFTASATTTTSVSSSAAATSAGIDVNVQVKIPILGGQSSSAAVAAASTTTTSPAAASSSAAASTGGGTTNSGSNSGQLTPNGKKAGLSAGDALQVMADHLGWWYNWAPTDEGTSNSKVQFVPMLWGGGSADSTDSNRLASFKSLSSTPTWIIGPEEPDCATGSGSAGMSIADTASIWNSLMAPKGSSGSLLLSPSMCKQMAEDGWLANFQTQVSRDFDILNLHINKNSMAGVKASLDYYYNKYKKPIWVTEFACVDDSSAFIPCTDQGQINQFISDIVDLFESDSRVYAYAYSNGYGLGSQWPVWSNGQLSASGQAYLNAISKYH